MRPILFLFIFLLSLGFVSAMSGSGSVVDPFLISTCQDFQDINLNFSASYVLVNDVDCSDTVNWNGGDGFLMLGGAFNCDVFEQCLPNTVFTGILDGRGYSVNDLFLNGSYAVFGTVWGNIRDLHFVDLYISNDMDGVSSFAYYLYGNISGCSVSGQIIGSDSSSASGLVYEVGSSGSISRSSSTAYLYGADVDGLVHQNDGVISRSFVDFAGESINGAGTGFANNYGTITESYAIVEIVSSGNTVGGSGFSSYNNGLISDCFTINNISGSVVGFAGYNGGSISNSFSVPVSDVDFTAGVGGGSVVNSYVQVLGAETNSVNGYKVKKFKLKNQNTFRNWDFNSKWQLCASVNDGYPSLRNVHSKCPSIRGVSTASDSLSGVSGSEDVPVPSRSSLITGAIVGVTESNSLIVSGLFWLILVLLIMLIVYLLNRSKKGKRR
jgi:hypothetical protein